LTLLGGGKPCTLQGQEWEDGIWMRTNASWFLSSYLDLAAGVGLLHLFLAAHKRNATRGNIVV